MRELCFRLCLPSIKYSNLLRLVCWQILFMKNIFKFNQVRFLSKQIFGSSWHLILQAEVFFCCVLRFLRQRLLCGFSRSSRFLTHTRAFAVSMRDVLSPSAGNWLRKVNIGKGCADIASRNQFSPGQAGQTVLSSIGREGKEIVFQQISIENMWKWWFTKHNKLCFMPRPPHSQALPEHLNKKQFFRYIFNSGRISQAFER